MDIIASRLSSLFRIIFVFYLYFLTILHNRVGYINIFWIDEAAVSIYKKSAIKVDLEVWQVGVYQKQENIISGFCSCGLYPVSYPAMQRRWKLYHNGGISKENASPVWIKAKEVISTKILTLPPHIYNQGCVKIYDNP